VDVPEFRADPSALTVGNLEAFDGGNSEAFDGERMDDTPHESSSEKLNKSGSGGEESGSGKSGHGGKSSGSGGSAHASRTDSGSGHGSGSGRNGSGSGGHDSGSGHNGSGSESRGCKVPSSSEETRVPTSSNGNKSGSTHSSSNSGPSTRKHTDGQEAITLISFSRYPVELRWALQSSPLLVPIRDALRVAGHNYELATGAKLFCGVDQYEEVAATMSRTDVDVRPYHVIFTESAREAVMVTLGSLRRALKVRVKEEMCLGHVVATKSQTPPAALSPPKTPQDTHGKAKGYPGAGSPEMQLYEDVARKPAQPKKARGPNAIEAAFGKNGKPGKKGAGKNGGKPGVDDGKESQSRIAAQLASQLANILERQDDPEGTLANSFMEGLDTMLQVYRATKETKPDMPWPAPSPVPVSPMPPFAPLNITDLSAIPAEWLAQYHLQMQSLPPFLQ
jgi:hypothetical protein